MILEDRYLRPFDRTYAAVTRAIEEEASRLSAPASDWLRRLVVAFQQERALWNARPELIAYRLRWLRFRTKLLRLVAGAYLHIAYDLPRALADDWPGRGNWAGGPPKDVGQAIYFRLAWIFPENLVRSARDFRTIGFGALFLRPVSRKALTSASIWIDALRKGAWLHAEILSTAPDRAQREAKMAEALTAALEDASLIHPWSIMGLLPPDRALYSSAWATIGALFFEILYAIDNYASVAILSAYLASRFVEHRVQLRASNDFIYVWGYLTDDYVSFAVREPEGFAEYRQRRRTALGLLPAAGASLA